MMDIPGIELEELAVTAVIHGVAARVVLNGTADTRATEELGRLFKEVHSRCTAAEVREVVVDFRELEFMNSSCFKAFVTWVSAVRDLDLGKQYKITFLSNKTLHWQRRSL